MFSNKDYLEYFEEIGRIEVEMQKRGHELSECFSDPRIKKMLRGLVKDEVRHAKIVTDLINLIKKEK
jgi:rubrerythrin